MRNMSRFAIVSLSISAGDAVGNDALEMHRILREHGHEVGLFNSHWVKKGPQTRDVFEAPAFLGDDPDAILLYHHAIGWEAGLKLFREAKCKRVVKYHNVTPGRFFAGFPGDNMRTCQMGREQMRELAQLPCELYLSDSDYNQGELLDAGADAGRCRVVPPFHHIDRLDALQADPEVLRRLDDGQTNLLFVGRRAPNKGHRYLIDAFAAYHEHYDRHSRLLLVGKEDRHLIGYSNQLREQASRLGVLDRVLFIDAVTEPELKGYYQSASAFVLASEHEGFCVPAVEAMALGVPVVAYASTAVPDTLGDAGLVWPEPDPFLLAQSIAEVVRDGPTRRALTERGRRRYREHFANQSIQNASSTPSNRWQHERKRYPGRDMPRIAIVSPNILPGDAIGHDALHMGRTLAAHGHEVELFSTNWGKPQPRNSDDRLVHEYLNDDPAALLILHHAIGWKHALPLITEAKCRRVVKYHNVTPAHFYEHLDQNYANLCRHGRSQMHELLEANCDLYLTDSSFNRDDLLDMDADPDRCFVVPPFNDIERLLAIEADPEVLRDYGDGRTNLLFVGRRAPNKGHRYLIDAFHAYHTHYDANSRLVLLGKGEPEPADYTAALRAQVRQLGLQGRRDFSGWGDGAGAEGLLSDGVGVRAGQRT